MSAPTLLELLAAGKAELAKAKTEKKMRAAHTGIDINALARQIEAELLWRSTHLVTIFNQQHCLACGNVSTSLQSVMVEQHHSRESGARRMLRSVDSHPDLPRRSECWQENVTCCAECYTDAHPLPTITPLPLLERPSDEDLA